MFEITELCLCEQNHLILTPNRLYKFVVDQNCKECLRLQAEGEVMPVKESRTLREMMAAWNAAMRASITPRDER